jgi:hypothetical protein
MGMRHSTKIAIGFLAISGGTYYGYQIITDQMVLGEKFPVLTPGDVNIVGIDPGAGYKIITANYMAQLVETKGSFENSSSDEGGADSGSIKRRVPVREMLQTLQGNGKALGQFVMIMNDMREDDSWPSVHVVWKAADIKKAIEGDPVLKPKLERDLNMHLDGMPLNTLNIDSLENGIIIETPVTVMVNLNGKVSPVTGPVQEPYTPRFIKQVQQQYKEKSDLTNQMQAGYYRSEATRLLEDPKLVGAREIISKSLLERISPSLAKERIQTPEKLLRSATIVVNNSLITGAKMSEYKGGDGKPYYDLTVDLNDEGRRRLWQYSKKRVGTQVLLTADGIPITQARIVHELAQSELTIKQMQDKNLVKDAVDRINGDSKSLN